MILFRENDYKPYILPNETAELGGGAFGVVYQTDKDKCLKVFNENPLEGIDEDVIKKLRSLDLPSLYKIYELYYDLNKKFIGYAMKYYNEEEPHILEKPFSFYLDGYAQGRQDMVLLSTSRISSCDLSPSNTIINDKGITLIDADLFYKSNDKLPLDDILSHNYFNLKNLYMNLLLSELSDYHGYTPEEILQMSDKLFDFFSDNENDAFLLKKAVCGMQKPIDLVRKLERK